MANLQTIAQFDFSGGINAVASPYLVSKKQVRAMTNLLMDEHGSLKTRDGMSVYTTVAAKRDYSAFARCIPTMGGAITLGAFKNAASGCTSIEQIGGTIFTQLDLSTDYATPQMIQVNNKMVFANGYEQLKYWDPATYAFASVNYSGTLAGLDFSAPPGAKYLTFHLGGVWAWNTGAATSTLSGPSCLRMSNLVPDTALSPSGTDLIVGLWPDDAYTHIAMDDGQVGTGMGLFTIAEAGISPTSVLLLFKNYSTYQLDGTLTVSGTTPQFSLRKVKTDLGCLASESVQFCTSVGLIRLTHKGFAVYDGVNDKIISEEVRPYIFGDGATIGSLDFTEVYKSSSVQVQNPPLYICACPTTGEGLDRIFVYDLIRKSWSILSYPVKFKCLANLSVNQNVISLLAAPVSASTATTTKIYSLFNGATTDDGTAIAWTWTSKPYFISSPTRLSYWRRAVVDLSFLSPQTLVTEFTVSGEPTFTKTTTQTVINLLNQNAWGSKAWGTLKYGGDPYADIRTSIDFGKISPSISVRFSGTGPIRFRGMEIHGRAKPLTRMTR
jgi:hypothetical protein